MPICPRDLRDKWYPCCQGSFSSPCGVCRKLGRGPGGQGGGWTVMVWQPGRKKARAVGRRSPRPPHVAPATKHQTFTQPCHAWGTLQGCGCERRGARGHSHFPQHCDVRRERETWACSRRVGGDLGRRRRGSRGRIGRAWAPPSVPSSTSHTVQSELLYLPCFLLRGRSEEIVTEQKRVHSGRVVVRIGNYIHEVLIRGCSLPISTNACRGRAASWALCSLRTCDIGYRQHGLA